MKQTDMKIRKNILLPVMLIIILMPLLFAFGSDVYALDIPAFIPHTKNQIQNNYVFSGAGQNIEIINAMVRVYTFNNNPYRPDQGVPQQEKKINGSGCIIYGSMVLTSAHVVSNQAFIEVRKAGESRRYQAHLLYVSHEADLALLAVDNDQFFQGVHSVEIGELPDIQKSVSIYGFPGTEEVVITKGIFSGIESEQYIHSNSFLPAGKIHAAIRYGNSGGPVIVNNKIAGLIMQVSRKREVALMIPGRIIKYFLKDIEDGRYDGLPDVALINGQIENSNKNKDDFNYVLFQPISFL